MSFGRIEKTELDYFELRNPDKIYVSKSFMNPLDKDRKRIINKVFEKEEDLTFDYYDIEKEYILRSSKNARHQVKIVALEKNNKIISIVLQKFINNNPQPESFSFYRHEFKNLITILNSIKFLDFTDEERYSLEDSSIDVNKVFVDASEKELLEAFKNLEGGDRKYIIEKIRNQNLTKEDLDILTGRREGIDIFFNKLYQETDWNEKEWQIFFEKNTWIFGYGLDYRFLGILQGEAYVSNVDIGGENSVITDFIVADEHFIHIVEIKRPDTPLFGVKKNRSESWKLSDEFIDSISQILTQKAEWNIKAEKENYLRNGSRIKQRTINPKTILIIGNTDQFKGTEKEIEIKSKTFELFRCNSRDIEILTYDELFKRAYFLVNQIPFENIGNQNNDDDIPF
ncbi:MAG: hypothetical protein A2X61_12020 [Ignavibacteria bacterium GWB2_35_12]|nr:MAG: hypothetical protein A2X63_05860 [Ignavibacteria bacterium GWA2_35_8]OGU41985.1 MAG: hypothetical protein A2X61_12020 [Ignavibacteria bacterium GWB2_35_12]OGU88210.1 MAG: hypothetical protein A2220_14965 [Ignavibacteria bacterium RIFOXYA2_FULL_35_10]OGV24421.1 MAG: hypothetical protein A2475_12580 [Ignavibacteria bacterium RIFOXYC2_FULL_35_21]